MPEPTIKLNESLHAYARQLRQQRSAGDGEIPGGQGQIQDDLCIVVVDMASRVLDRAEVTLLPGKVPHSRAAYIAGFSFFLTSTLKSLLADKAIAVATDDIALRTGRVLFQAFGDSEWKTLYGKGTQAVAQMLTVLEKAGQLEPWAASITAAVRGFIVSPNEHDLETLTRQFVALPLQVSAATV